jgi:hypothetical protein
MKLRKFDWLFVACALAVIIGVSLLPTPKDRNPRIPGSAGHRSVTMEQGCIQCHQAGGENPVPQRHPRRQDCFRCHARAE